MTLHEIRKKFPNLAMMLQASERSLDDWECGLRQNKLALQVAQWIGTGVLLPPTDPPPMMDAPAFVRAQNRLGLSIMGTARILCVTGRTVFNWNNGRSRIDPLASSVMTWMLAGFRPPNFKEGADLRRDGKSKRWQT